MLSSSSSLLTPLPALPLQVGIQVASEDLCSEKQWNVCKALATFVAHREFSKVRVYTWLFSAAGPPVPVLAGLDQGS